MFATQRSANPILVIYLLRSDLIPVYKEWGLRWAQRSIDGDA